MVKPTTFNYIVVSKANNGSYSYILMPITDNDIETIKNVSQYNKGFKKVININNFTFGIDDINMFGESKSDIELVHSLIERVCPDYITAPAVINLKEGTHSIEIVPGYSIDKFYDYHLLLIGNPNKIILFKHYGPIK
jgi:hypothetical protein